MGLLINAQTLSKNLSSTIIFDCRFALTDSEIGRQQYQEQHIPGARYADLEKDLSSAPGSGGRHPLPDREDLVNRLRAWGVNKDSSIVCYDQNAGAFAARLWWLLRWLGHENVMVLDGGLDVWLKQNLAVDADLADIRPGNFEAAPSLTKTWLAEQLPDPEITLIDARDAARFRGEVEPIDPIAGHIPGAICATFTDNLTEGQFKSPDSLRQRFESLDLGLDNELVCYCGSGVTATHNILALMLAGYPEPALYPGSWSEWITDPARPVATVR